MKKNPENLRLSASQNGFTLIEMMIAMVLGLIVISGVYQVFSSQQKAYSIQGQVAEMQQNARVAMDMMTREIKMAGYIAESWDGDPGTAAPTSDVAGQSWTDGGAEDIEESSANSITFEADVIAVTGEPNDRTETVRYSRSGNNLVRETWTWNGAAWVNYSGQQPLAENITSLIFTYDNVTRSNIRLIQISVTARTAREDPGFTSGGVHIDASTPGMARIRTLKAYVRPRNLGL